MSAKFLKYSVAVLVLLGIPASGLSITADSVRFTGSAPEYGGYHIVFNRYSNFIIPEISEIAVMHIEKNGDFDFTFGMDEICYIFADLGRFRTCIYVEPGTTYTLTFPPFEPLTDEQRLTPLLQLEEIPFGIKNREAQVLNRNIIEFNSEFNNAYNTNAMSLFISAGSKRTDSIINSLEQRFACTHPYFAMYKKYSYLKLQQLSQRTYKKTAIAQFAQNAPAYTLPIYWEVFRTLMSGYLPASYSGTVEISLPKAIISGMAFDSITVLLMSDTLFCNREFAEASLLFMLFESFYRKTINESKCLEITRSAVEKASTEQLRTMALLFFKKMAALRQGTLAPEFSLLNRRNRTVELSDYKGKFLYLGFVHTKNHACLLDIPLLDQMEKMLKKELQIVTIVIDDDFDAMVEFIKKNSHYKWDFLHFGQQASILNNYNLKGVPLYYLIDPEGKLSLSPAPSPRENFQQIFAEIYIEYQRKNQRRNPPKEKSIFDL